MAHTFPATASLQAITSHKHRKAKLGAARASTTASSRLRRDAGIVNSITRAPVEEAQLVTMDTSTW